jgi:hypothetical protein
MKSYSSGKLVRFAIENKHIVPCQNQGKSRECVCWITEAQNWDKRMKDASKLRVRKPRSNGKIHMQGKSCGAKGTLKTSAVTTEVNCQHCIKIMNAPIKSPKKVKASASQMHLPMN